MYNWSPVLFDFPQHPFLSSGNIHLFSRKPQTSSAIIHVSSFHVKGRHIMGQQLLASLPIDLSFCISTVLSLVIYRGVFPSKQGLRCHTSFLCKLVKFFRQNPWTASGTGAFQLKIFFNIFFSFSCQTCTRACLFFLFISSLISLNQVASLLCSTPWPQISVQNAFASCTSGLQYLLPLHFHGYKINPHCFQKIYSVRTDSLFPGTC